MRVLDIVRQRQVEQLGLTPLEQLDPGIENNSDRSAEYMSGLPRPTIASISASAHSDEKQMPSRLRPSSLRNLSLAVIAATLTPEPAISARMVSLRIRRSSVTMISRPLSRSR